jgi:hypothetical protein
MLRGKASVSLQIIATQNSDLHGKADEQIEQDFAICAWLTLPTVCALLQK